MIASRLSALRDRLSAACKAAGRDPASVRLLAVSKTFGGDSVAQAIAAGQLAFGENYIAEGVEKIVALRQYPLLEWHCIGPVQSNKTRLVAEHFDWVQSVDRLKIAQRLNEQRPPHLPPLQLCLQVNVDGGANKSGVTPDELMALIQEVIKLPRLRAYGADRSRPIGEIMRQPLFISAAICGIISYLLMNFLMTSAPLAMHMEGHQQAAADDVIQWHVIAMYAPSFFTGRLITRFGAGKITAVGLALIAAAAAVGYSGMTVPHFMGSLILLGLGWNFGFTGGSAMVLNTHSQDERARVQSVYDFLVFGSVAVGSFLSGGILVNYGWQVVCALAIPPVIAAWAALMRFRAAAPMAAE